MVMLDKFDRSKPGFTAIAPKVTQSKAQAVLMVASSQSVIDAIQAVRAAGSAAQIMTLSNNASGGFVKSLGTGGPSMIVTQIFSDEHAITYAMVKEARELAKAKGQNDISPAMLEGFAAAKVLVEGVRRAGPKPSREKIHAVLEGMQKLDIGGLEVNYSLKEHSGLDFADLSIIGSDRKFER
jgi:branched-chain amino acid transport system substrate-binding protein